MLSSASPVRPALPWPRWVEVVAVGVFWLLFMAAALLWRAFDPRIPFSSHTLAVTLIEYGPWLLVTPLVFGLVRRFPPEAARWGPRLALYAVVGAGVVLAMSGFNAAAFRALGPPPGIGFDRRSAPPRPPSPAEGMRGARFGRRPDGGPPLFAPSLHVLFYLIVLGGGVARVYALQADARRAEAVRLLQERTLLEAEHQRLAAQAAEARLSMLRLQLRPHFLFNALNAVAALAGDDPAEVRRIVARLSSLLRAVLDADTRPLVPLRDELAFLRDYVAVQRVRFDTLDVTESIDPSLLDVAVPTLILQPLVENAIEHGGAGRETAHIHIAAHRTDTHLVLTVADDGPGLGPASPAHPHVGLVNTRDRLAAHYGRAATLVLRDALGGGAEALLTLPLPPDFADDA